MTQTPREILARNAGARVSRRCRATGTVVTLYDGDAAGMDTEGGPDGEKMRWQTVCEEHGTVICHRTFEVALSHLSHPDEWCEECPLLEKQYDHDWE